MIPALAFLVFGFCVGFAFAALLSRFKPQLHRHDVVHHHRFHQCIDFQVRIVDADPDAGEEWKKGVAP